MSTCSTSAASRAASGNEVIGIDLGTTNSCVAVMEGKVRASRGCRGGSSRSMRAVERSGGRLCAPHAVLPAQPCTAVTSRAAEEHAQLEARLKLPNRAALVFERSFRWYGG